jgi:hypothetical protein
LPKWRSSEWSCVEPLHAPLPSTPNIKTFLIRDGLRAVGGLTAPKLILLDCSNVDDKGAKEASEAQCSQLPVA